MIKRHTLKIWKNIKDKSISQKAERADSIDEEPKINIQNVNDESPNVSHQQEVTPLATPISLDLMTPKFHKG